MSPSGSGSATDGSSAHDLPYPTIKGDIPYAVQRVDPTKYIALGTTDLDSAGHVTCIPEYIPRPPVFDSLLEERQDRLRNLAAGFRVFAKYGFGFGNNGHITARDPVRKDCFWINPYGIPFSKITVSDLILVDSQGNTIHGKHPTCNPAGWCIHHMLHEQRPDIVSAAHAHTPYGTTWSAFGKELVPYAQDSCAIYERHVVFDGLPLISNTVEAKKMASFLGAENTVILARNHGIFTVGSTVQECLWWFLLTERICEYNTKILSCGKLEPVPISHEVAVQAREGGVGGKLAGWFGFLPHYREIVEEQPDLLN